MEKSKMKNMIVLKNLPSNLIDEAFIIFKSNKMAKSYRFIENNSSKKNKNSDYMVKEAEYVIENFIKSKEREKLNKKSYSKRHNVLKIYSLIITVAFITACFLM